jgi:hypothetical protein
MYFPATLPGTSQTTSSAKRPDHSRLSSPANLTLLIQEAAERRRHLGKKAREPSGQLAKQRLFARDVIPSEVLPISKKPRHPTPTPPCLQENSA